MTDEQRSQRGVCQETLRAAVLLAVSCVGSAVTARSGMRRPHRLGHRQNSSPQGPSEFSDRLLSPGIELALVSSSEDARRFHLWEATPIKYLERLVLHNQLVPGLNVLEGILSQADGDLAIVTSQPRFEVVPVTEAEVDHWFEGQGFLRITHSAYYRAEDNLGVFDAHSRNVVRAGDVLVPFDVIPCHPAGGFLRFIEDTLRLGHGLTAVRRVSTPRG